MKIQLKCSLNMEPDLQVLVSPEVGLAFAHLFVPEKATLVEYFSPLRRVMTHEGMIRVS